MLVAAAIALTGALAACSGGGGGGANNGGGASGGADASGCSNTIPKADLPVVTMWAWYPNMELVVDNFNEANDEVQVCWTNVGQGGDAYNRIQTAITAGSGLPDIMMIEADRIPTFQVQGALADLTDLGYADVVDNYSEGAWSDVSVAGGVYGVPVDGGPMGMIYRADVFEQYGITPPTTWDEYRAAAETVRDAGGPLFGDLGANVPAVMVALQYQNGAQPFVYDPENPEQISINLNDEASTEVYEYWAGLAADGLIGTQDQFTPEYIAGVINGDYATYISAAWAPGYLTGAGVGEGEDSDVWRVAPLPQWDPANPVSVNWGGSAFAVSATSENVELAAQAAFGVYADPASLDDGWRNQVIFPLNLSVLNSPEFEEFEVPFFSGQQANAEVYVPAANAYEGMTYVPFGQFYYTTRTAALADMLEGSITGSEAADQVQETVVQFAEEQGFTIVE